MHDGVRLAALVDRLFASRWTPTDLRDALVAIDAGDGPVIVDLMMRRAPPGDGSVEGREDAVMERLQGVMPDDPVVGGMLMAYLGQAESFDGVESFNHTVYDAIGLWIDDQRDGELSERLHRLADKLGHPHVREWAESCDPRRPR
ncbi:MAG: hypothetical protein ACHREM_08210 [Polyangiales bacterium]